MPDTTRSAMESLLASLPATGAPRVLITGGPTCEDIDDVRFITNRSTGAMGIALAAEALARGWQPLLVMGPTHLPPPADCPCFAVRSAHQMCDAVLAALPWCNALVMSAAVADYTPAAPQTQKLKKQDGDLFLQLKRTQDILQAVAAHPARVGKCIIGFALDSGIDLAAAEDKLVRKKLDAILVNSTQAFGAKEVTAHLLTKAAPAEALGTPTKAAIARRLLDFAQHQLQQ